MKVTRIQADNLLGLKSVDVKLSTAITLFAGRNGAGKSSIQEAVRMAFTRDTVRDINLKKEFGSLVHDGEKAGGAQVIVDGDTENSFAFNMPKGDFTGPEITESMRVALYGQRFADMKPDERRTFLFELTKCKRNGEAVKARMLAPKWKCQEAKIDAVLPLLRTGFPSVCDHAKSKATEAKGAWRQLTGEVYGSVKAETWLAPIVELPAGDAAALAEQLAGIDKIIATQNESLGAIKQTASAAGDAAAKREKLAGAPARVVDLTAQLALAKEDLAEYEPTVVALRERAAGTGKLTMADELAHFLASLPIPKLGKELEESANAILRRYEATGGDYGVAAGKVDIEAQAALPENEKGLLVMQNRVKNLQRDLDAATQQKGQYDALAPDGEVLDVSKEVAEIEAMLATARADRVRVENQRLDIEAATRKQAEAATKTQAAAGHHAEVVEWTKVADALAPDGIPSEILLEALTPVNAALAQAAVDAEWMKVAIGADMSITADGRPRHLLSVSEKWRADAMIAQVVAEISGIKILMLDGVDVLDLPGRTQLFSWLDTLADLELIDTALLFATLKSLPEGLGEAVECFWVENGTIASQFDKQAAA